MWFKVTEWIFIGKPTARNNDLGCIILFIWLVSYDLGKLAGLGNIKLGEMKCWDFGHRESATLACVLFWELMLTLDLLFFTPICTTQYWVYFKMLETSYVENSIWFWWHTANSQVVVLSIYLLIQHVGHLCSPPSIIWVTSLHYIICAVWVKIIMIFFFELSIIIYLVSHTNQQFKILSSLC